MRPVIAAAAAVSGDARNVRPPRPWRPSKLRLLVLPAYWPGSIASPFIAMHIEQPHARGDPLAAHHGGGGAHVGQPRVRARADEHDIDRLSEQRLARCEAHVRERLRARGTGAEIAIAMPGFVPNVIIGWIRDASITTVRSNAAPSSVCSSRQRWTAACQAAPRGACARFASQANVVASGAIIPARAPASIDMLQTVIRPSMSRARIASPVYSMTYPVAPPTPRSANIASTRSFAESPAGSAPSTRTSPVI